MVMTLQDTMQPAMQSPKSSKFIRSVKVIQVDKPDEGTAYSDMPVLNNTESVMQEIYSLDSQRDLCGENLSASEIVAEHLSPVNLNAKNILCMYGERFSWDIFVLLIMILGWRIWIINPWFTM